MNPSLTALPGGRRTVQAVAVLALAAVVSLIGAVSAMAAPTWLTPRAISNTAQSVDTTTWDTAMDPEGNVVAVWARSDGTNVRIQAASRAAGSPTTGFGDPQTLSSAGRNASHPQVAIDDAGTAVATWVENDGTRDNIRAASLPRGGSFGSSQLVSDALSSASEPVVETSAAGSSLIAWVQGGSVRARSRNTTGALGAILPVSGTGVQSNTSDFDGLQMGMNREGNASVAYVRNDGVTGSRVESAYRVRGGAFGPAQAISPVNNVSGPSVDVDESNNVTVVWEFFNGSAYVAQASFKSASGLFPGTPETLPGSTGARIPRVAVDSEGTAIAVWITSASGPFQVQAATRPLNSAFQSPQNVGAPGNSALYPDVVVDRQDRALLAWNLQDAGGFKVMSAVRPKGGSFGAVSPVSSPGAGFFRPRLGSDSEGNAVAVYVRNNGSTQQAEAAGFDRSGPRLNNVNVPSGGTRGDSLSFSASPLDVWSAVPGNRWDFGDGQGADGASVQHAYGSAGTYSASLTATDALGNSSGTSRQVQIQNPPDPPPTNTTTNTTTITPPPPPPPPPLVPTSLSSAFAASAKSTKVTKLILRNLLANSTVTVTCSGKGRTAQKACPYRRKVIRVTKAARSLSLTKPFKSNKRKLRVKTKLVIRVTAPGSKGKVFSYTIRKLALPKFSLQCTQPGATKAGSCL